MIRRTFTIQIEAGTPAQAATFLRSAETALVWAGVKGAIHVSETCGAALEPLLPLSTAHAPSAAELDAAIKAHAAMERSEGALFHAGEGGAASQPEWLRALTEHARACGAVWLLLDCDADRAPALPAFDW